MNKELQKEAVKWGAIILIVLIIIYFVGKGVKSVSSKLGIGKSEEEKKRTEEAVRELSKGINTKKLTYQPQAYKNYANALYLAMKGPGTDYSTLWRVLRYPQNGDDIKQLVSVFGVRDGLNLMEWVRSEIPSTASTAIFSANTFKKDFFTLDRLNQVYRNSKIPFQW